MEFIRLFESFDDNYEFRIGDDLFRVEFVYRKDYWELMYYIWDGNNWSVSKTSTSSPYKIVDRVFGYCLNDFIVKKKPKKILIKGLPKDRQREYVSPRTKLYVRYLRLNVPRGMRMTYPSKDIVNNKIILEYID